MERVTACQDFLSDTVYREMCDSNPGSKHNILFHTATMAGQTASIKALRTKKKSFRRIHTEGVGDCFIISLLNGRDGSEVSIFSEEQALIVHHATTIRMCSVFAGNADPTQTVCKFHPSLYNSFQHAFVVCSFQEFSFADAVIEEAKKSIGRVLVQHATVGVYRDPEDVGAAEDRPLRLFEAARARACGIKLSHRPTLHSLCQDIETQMSARHYVNLLALGAATDALKLGLVVLWVQSKDHSDEYVVYFNEMVSNRGYLYRRVGR
jgi:hypothetical protein